MHHRAPPRTSPERAPCALNCPKKESPPGFPTCACRHALSVYVAGPIHALPLAKKSPVGGRPREARSDQPPMSCDHLAGQARRALRGCKQRANVELQMSKDTSRRSAVGSRLRAPHSAFSASLVDKPPVAHARRLWRASTPKAPQGRYRVAVGANPRLAAKRNVESPEGAT